MVMVTNSIVVSDGDLENTFEGRDHEELNLGSVAGVTDRGIRHERNEDAFALATAETPAGPAVIAVVCDGVSSADRPDEASLEAARAAVYELAEAAQAGADLAAASRQAIESARDAVIGLSEDPEETPAATYVSAVVTPGTITLCWMGDSRAYWLSAGPEPMAQLLTRDDSLAEEMVAQGLLPEADALESPQAHVVTRWIGIGAREAEPHVEQFTPPGRGALLRLLGRPVELRPGRRQARDAGHAHRPGQSARRGHRPAAVRAGGRWRGQHHRGRRALPAGRIGRRPPGGSDGARPAAGAGPS